MINFFKFFFITLFLFKSAFATSMPSSKAASASDSASFQIKIFDVGQGNCVAIKYKGKSILIDCGSRSLSFTAQYHKTASAGAGAGAAIALSKTTSKGKTGAKADSDEDSDTDVAAKELAKATLHTPSPKTKLKFEATPGRKARDSSSEDSGEEVDKKAKDQLRNEYKDKIVEEIREFLGDTIQAVIITHPDEDHYNLIPDVTAEKRVENVIISSAETDYLESKKPDSLTFKRWIQSHSSIIHSLEGFYFSDKESKDATEMKIERAITFASTTSDEPLPEIKILAMNATAGEMRDPNGDSIVLKVIYNDKSILLPGDATDRTWATINPENLKSNYFLVSHHGAATHGSTSPAILSAIDPEAVFVSAGRYRGYYHPDQSVINMLISSLHLGENPDFQRFVTYFSEKKHRRLTTGSLIFTTLNNGTITIDLGSNTAHTTRAKTPTQYHFGRKSYTADKSFAFKEQSVSDPSNRARLFSNLIKKALEGSNICFYRIATSKTAGVATLRVDENRSINYSRYL